MKKILFLFLLFTIKQVNAQTWVTISDVNFANWLQANIPSAMNGNQMDITSAAVINRTSIINNSWNIANLNGIQYFTSLH